MRSTNAHSLLRALALAALPAMPCLARAQVTVRVQNPAAFERRDETIAIAWSALRAKLPALAANRVRVRESASGAEIAIQALDSDMDGATDTLLFQSSFYPNETRAFVVEAAAPAAPAKARAHVKYIPERTDVAWESDRMAWRTYGQLLWQLENLHTSGVDVWVKRTRDLVLDKWYAGGHDFYHLDRGEGADFYKVGPTLGGGATAIWHNGQIYRAENFKNYKIIADGPVRAIFELYFEPWQAGSARFTQTNRIAIDAGSNLYWQQSVFSIVGGGADSLQYVLGFVKRPGLIGSTSRARAWMWLTGWGPVDNKYGEGGHGELGTAVLLERARAADVKETDEHFFVVANAKAGVPVVQYVGAGWTGSRDFADVEDWWKYLDEFSRRLAAPLRITIGQ
jgi:pectinesterase